MHTRHSSDISLASTLDEYSPLLCTSFPLYPNAATDDGSAGADGPDGA